MRRRASREQRVAALSRAQLLDLVRSPLEPAKDAALAYHLLEERLA